VRARRKKWAVPYLEEHPEIVIDHFAKEDPFNETPDLYLEIGAGKGDFVIAMAQRGGHYIALERDDSIAGLLAKKVLASGLANIRVFPCDFDYGYESLKEGRFAKIFLNFSDPWPKKRHWKRRLTTVNRLKQMDTLLQAGGTLVFKSDNDDLYLYTKEQAPLAGFAIVLDQPDYVFDPADDAMSEYEKNFRALGKPIHRLVLKKKKE
jgi:tRNA (guanine-N7-)-methyltransferase